MGTPIYEWPAIESELEVCSSITHFTLVAVTSNVSTKLKFPSDSCTSALCMKVDVIDLTVPD